MISALSERNAQVSPSRAALVRARVSVMISIRFALFDTPSAAAASPGASAASSACSCPSRRARDARPPAAALSRCPRSGAARRRGARHRGRRRRCSRGEARDLATVALDMEGVPPFHRRVYEAARAIRARHDARRTARSRRASARPARRAPSDRRSGGTRSRSSCPAIACSRRAARWAASRATAASTTKLRMLAIEGGADAEPQAGALRRRRRRSASIRRPRSRTCARADPTLARVIDAVGAVARSSSRRRRASSARSPRRSSTSS